MQRPALKEQPTGPAVRQGMRNGMTLINHPTGVSFKGIPGFIPSFPTDHQQVCRNGVGKIWTPPHESDPQTEVWNIDLSFGKCTHSHTHTPTHHTADHLVGSALKNFRTSGIKRSFSSQGMSGHPDGCVRGGCLSTSLKREPSKNTPHASSFIFHKQRSGVGFQALKLKGP